MDKNESKNKEKMNSKIGVKEPNYQSSLDPQESELHSLQKKNRNKQKTEHRRRKLWKNLSNIFSSSKNERIAEENIEHHTHSSRSNYGTRTIRRLSTIFRSRRNAEVAPSPSIKESSKGHQAILSDPHLNQSGDKELVMAVKLPSGTSYESLAITLELETNLNDDQYVPGIKYCEESESKTIFTGRITVPPHTTIAKLVNMPLYLIHSEEKVVMHPDVDIKPYSFITPVNIASSQNDNSAVKDLKLKVKLDKDKENEKELKSMTNINSGTTENVSEIQNFGIRSLDYGFIQADSIRDLVSGTSNEHFRTTANIQKAIRSERPLRNSDGSQKQRDASTQYSYTVTKESGAQTSVTLNNLNQIKKDYSSYSSVSCGTEEVCKRIRAVHDPSFVLLSTNVSKSSVSIWPLSSPSSAKSSSTVISSPSNMSSFNITELVVPHNSPAHRSPNKHKKCVKLSNNSINLAINKYDESFKRRVEYPEAKTYFRASEKRGKALTVEGTKMELHFHGVEDSDDDNSYMYEIDKTLELLERARTRLIKDVNSKSTVYRPQTIFEREQEVLDTCGLLSMRPEMLKDAEAENLNQYCYLSVPPYYPHDISYAELFEDNPYISSTHLKWNNVDGPSSIKALENYSMCNDHQVQKKNFDLSTKTDISENFPNPSVLDKFRTKRILTDTVYTTQTTQSPKLPITNSANDKMVSVENSFFLNGPPRLELGKYMKYNEYVSQSKNSKMCFDCVIEEPTNLDKPKTREGQNLNTETPPPDCSNSQELLENTIQEPVVSIITSAFHVMRGILLPESTELADITDLHLNNPKDTVSGKKSTGEIFQNENIGNCLNNGETNPFVSRDKLTFDEGNQGNIGICPKDTLILIEANKFSNDDIKGEPISNKDISESLEIQKSCLVENAKLFLENTEKDIKLCADKELDILEDISTSEDKQCILSENNMEFTLKNAEKQPIALTGASTSAEVQKNYYKKVTATCSETRRELGNAKDNEMKDIQDIQQTDSRESDLTGNDGREISSKETDVAAERGLTCWRNEHHVKEVIEVEETQISKGYILDAVQDEVTEKKKMYEPEEIDGETFQLNNDAIDEDITPQMIESGIINMREIEIQFENGNIENCLQISGTDYFGQEIAENVRNYLERIEERASICLENINQVEIEEKEQELREISEKSSRIWDSASKIDEILKPSTTISQQHNEISSVTGKEEFFRIIEKYVEEQTKYKNHIEMTLQYNQAEQAEGVVTILKETRETCARGNISLINNETSVVTDKGKHSDVIDVQDSFLEERIMYTDTPSSKEMQGMFHKQNTGTPSTKEETHETLSNQRVDMTLQTNEGGQVEKNLKMSESEQGNLIISEETLQANLKGSGRTSLIDNEMNVVTDKGCESNKELPDMANEKENDALNKIKTLKISTMDSIDVQETQNSIVNGTETETKQVDFFATIENNFENLSTLQSLNERVHRENIEIRSEPSYSKETKHELRETLAGGIEEFQDNDNDDKYMLDISPKESEKLSAEEEEGSFNVIEAILEKSNGADFAIGKETSFEMPERLVIDTQEVQNSNIGQNSLQIHETNPSSDKLKMIDIKENADFLAETTGDKVEVSFLYDQNTHIGKCQQNCTPDLGTCEESLREITEIQGLQSNRNMDNTKMYNTAEMYMDLGEILNTFLDEINGKCPLNNQIHLPVENREDEVLKRNITSSNETVGICHQNDVTDSTIDEEIAEEVILKQYSNTSLQTIKSERAVDEMKQYGIKETLSNEVLPTTNKHLMVPQSDETNTQETGSSFVNEILKTGKPSAEEGIRPDVSESIITDNYDKIEEDIRMYEMVESDIEEMQESRSNELWLINSASKLSIELQKVLHLPEIVIQMQESSFVSKLQEIKQTSSEESVELSNQNSRSLGINENGLEGTIEIKGTFSKQHSEDVEGDQVMAKMNVYERVESNKNVQDVQETFHNGSAPSSNGRNLASEKQNTFQNSENGAVDVRETQSSFAKEKLVIQENSLNGSFGIFQQNNATDFVVTKTDVKGITKTQEMLLKQESEMSFQNNQEVPVETKIHVAAENFVDVEGVAETFSSGSSEICLLSNETNLETENQKLLPQTDITEMQQTRSTFMNDRLEKQEYSSKERLGFYKQSDLVDDAIIEKIEADIVKLETMYSGEHPEISLQNNEASEVVEIYEQTVCRVDEKENQDAVSNKICGTCLLNNDTSMPTEKYSTFPIPEINLMGVQRTQDTFTNEELELLENSTTENDAADFAISENSKGIIEIQGLLPKEHPETGLQIVVEDINMYETVEKDVNMETEEIVSNECSFVSKEAIVKCNARDMQEITVGLCRQNFLPEFSKQCTETDLQNKTNQTVVVDMDVAEGMDVGEMGESQSSKRSWVSELGSETYLQTPINAMDAQKSQNTSVLKIEELSSKDSGICHETGVIASKKDADNIIEIEESILKQYSKREFSGNDEALEEIEMYETVASEVDRADWGILERAVEEIIATQERLQISDEVNMYKKEEICEAVESEVDGMDWGTLERAVEENIATQEIDEILDEVNMYMKEDLGLEEIEETVSSESHINLLSNEKDLAVERPSVCQMLADDAMDMQVSQMSLANEILEMRFSSSEVMYQQNSSADLVITGNGVEQITLRKQSESGLCNNKKDEVVENIQHKNENGNTTGLGISTETSTLGDIRKIQNSEKEPIISKYNSTPHEMQEMLLKGDMGMCLEKPQEELIPTRISTLQEILQEENIMKYTQRACKVSKSAVQVFAPTSKDIRSKSDIPNYLKNTEEKPNMFSKDAEAEAAIRAAASIKVLKEALSKESRDYFLGKNIYLRNTEQGQIVSEAALKKCDETCPEKPNEEATIVQIVNGVTETNEQNIEENFTNRSSETCPQINKNYSAPVKVATFVAEENNRKETQENIGMCQNIQKALSVKCVPTLLQNSETALTTAKGNTYEAETTTVNIKQIRKALSLDGYKTFLLNEIQSCREDVKKMQDYIADEIKETCSQNGEQNSVTVKEKAFITEESNLQVLQKSFEITEDNKHEESENALAFKIEASAIKGEEHFDNCIVPYQEESDKSKAKSGQVTPLPHTTEDATINQVFATSSSQQIDNSKMCLQNLQRESRLVHNSYSELMKNGNTLELLKSDVIMVHEKLSGRNDETEETIIKQVSTETPDSQKSVHDKSVRVYKEETYLLQEPDTIQETVEVKSQNVSHVISLAQETREIELNKRYGIDEKEKEQELAKERRETYAIVENDVKDMIAELLRESNEIKSTVLLNGGEEDGPPLSYRYMLPTDDDANVFCNVIFNEIVNVALDVAEERFNEDSSLSSETEEDVEYIIKELFDIVSNNARLETYNDQVEISEVEHTKDNIISTNTADDLLSGVNKKSLSCSNLKNQGTRQTLYFCCRNNTLNSKIPKTSWIFGESRISTTISHSTQSGNKILPIISIRRLSPAKKFEIKGTEEKLTRYIERSSGLLTNLFNEMCTYNSFPRDLQLYTKSTQQNRKSYSVALTSELSSAKFIEYCDTPSCVCPFKTSTDNVPEEIQHTITSNDIQYNLMTSRDNCENCDSQNSQPSTIKKSKKFVKGNQVTEPSTSQGVTVHRNSTEDEKLVEDTSLAIRRDSSEPKLYILPPKLSQVSGKSRLSPSYTSSSDDDFNAKPYKPITLKNDIIVIQRKRSIISDSESDGCSTLAQEVIKSQIGTVSYDSRVRLKPTPGVPDIKDGDQRLGSHKRKMSDEQGADDELSDDSDVNVLKKKKRKEKAAYDQECAVSVPIPDYQYISFLDLQNSDEIAKIEKNVNENCNLEEQILPQPDTQVIILPPIPVEDISNTTESIISSSSEIISDIIDSTSKTDTDQ